MVGQFRKWGWSVLCCLLLIIGHALHAQTPPVVWAWGNGNNGQLGDGSFSSSPLPVLTLDTALALSEVSDTSDATFHTLYLKTDGTVWATGVNSYGNLGDGTLTTRYIPVPVKGVGGNGVLTDVLAVSTGSYHSLALKTNGTVWAWGHNGNGQCGDGTSDQRTTPVQVLGPGGVGVLSNIVAISAGSLHSMALKSDGTVWAWGYNGYGQLGDGTYTDSWTPVQIQGPGGMGFLTGVTALSSRGHHALTLKGDGTVWAWGYNSSGEIGDGTTDIATFPTQVVGVGGVGLLSGAASVSAGLNHSLVVLSNGRVVAFGNNGYGQLGDNTTNNSAVPVQVKGPNGTGLLTGIGSADTQYYHNVAVKSDGTVWGWGYNDYGQLGNGVAATAMTPVQMLSLDGITFLTGAASASAGTYHSSVVKSDSAVCAVGYNGYGNLGDGTTVTTYTPVRSFVPSNPIGLANTVQVASGHLHSVAARADGTVVAWGDNYAGALGDGTTTGRLHPVAVKGVGGIGVLMDVVAVSAGLYYSTALLTNGEIVSWGYNGYGELGNNTYTDSVTPVQVKGPNGIGVLSGAVSLASGAYHSLASKSDGTVWAWGYGGSGELGQGDGTTHPASVQVKGPNGVGHLAGIITVACGYYFSVALHSDGTVWIWGSNSNGQLGDGTTESRPTPARVKGPGGVGVLSDIVEVRAGYYHCLALKADGTVWAWGYNGNGQLGDNSTVDRHTPVQVKGQNGVGFLTGVVAISAGQYHNHIIKTDGSVWAWGNNSSGELGDGTYEPRLAPVRVKDETGNGFLNKIVSISGGQYHTLAIRADGAIGGTVNLQNVQCYGATIHFVFRDLNGGPDILREIQSGLRGVFSFTDIPPGRYDVAVKGHKWLRQVIRNVVTESGDNILNLRVFLRGGDSNDDNSVDVLDLDVLIQAFDSTPPDAWWNEGADFNCDMSVDVLDLDLLIQNFDIEGDA